MRKKQPKYLKNTPSGKRAIRQAKAGAKGVAVGTGRGSIQSGTVTVGIPGKKRGPDRERTMLIPHIVQNEDGTMQKLTPAQAEKRALKTGDYARVKNPEVGKRRSKKFSKRLGKLAEKARKKARKKTK